ARAIPGLPASGRGAGALANRPAPARRRGGGPVPRAPRHLPGRSPATRRGACAPARHARDPHARVGSVPGRRARLAAVDAIWAPDPRAGLRLRRAVPEPSSVARDGRAGRAEAGPTGRAPCERARAREPRSEEHTSELQSRENLVCRLLLEKKKKSKNEI